jgi:hypothetical protein
MPPHGKNLCCVLQATKKEERLTLCSSELQSQKTLKALKNKRKALLFYFNLVPAYAASTVLGQL